MTSDGGQYSSTKAERIAGITAFFVVAAVAVLALLHTTRASAATPAQHAAGIDRTHARTGNVSIPAAPALLSA